MMLYNRISPADLSQFFRDTLFLYNGEPVYCKGVNGMELELFFLKEQKSAEVLFDAELCKPLSGRIGMVNTMRSSVFVSRLPHRKFQIGMSRNNSSIVLVGYHGDPNASINIKKLTSKDIVAAINNEYPPFERCYNLAIEKGGTFAFDKQFCVDAEKSIYYRTSRVGVAVDGNIDNIKWNKGKEYLQLLLGGKYETDSRNFRPT